MQTESKTNAVWHTDLRCS